MRVNLISLGCPKNLVDSEKLLGSLCASGVEITNSAKDSDIIIINTCGFIKPAIEETEDEIEKVLQIAMNDKKKVYVYGCAVNRARFLLREKFPDVSAWFKLEEANKLLSVINGHARIIETRLPTTHGYAYLKIAEGCSNHCSYCTIPLIKGEYRSFEFDRLVGEAYDLSKLGIREIILIAQDTTRYGLDKYGKPMLVPLVREVAKIPGVKWIRIMYAHPKTLNEEMIAEIERNRKVCKYLDLPIQHINDRILKLMNRQVTRETIERALARLRKVNGMSLRTTIITGFPTETDVEFKELVKFLKQTNFDWLGVFPYYRESDTVADKLAQVPKSIVKRRYKELISLQKSQIKKNNSRRLGRFYKTLVHARNGHFLGHTAFAAPEIDGQIIIRNRMLKVGRFYQTKIRGLKEADFYADTRKQCKLH